MTLLTIPVTRLTVAAPAGTLIHASQLAEFLAAEDIIAAAQAQAEQILQRAELDAEHLQQYCDKAQEAARQEGLMQVEEEAPALRQQAVADTIQWLIETHEVERRVVEQLEVRLRRIMVQVFEEFYGQQNDARLLMAHLHRHIDALLDEATGTLHVNESQYDELRQAFVTHPQLRVKPDARLQPGEARLNTSLVSLYLNLDEQLQSILSRLEQLSQESADDQQD
ncbi:FliH/SctL family protein [Winslowiella toletana]|uniref:FliH/SctL family protein n=1 Tax=Winslowiella toletana TaxID=92490 RepID=UPI0028BDA4B2|nr:hypothetical protein [Winslowiella toletana]WNN43895.1 hypothetical protein RIN69_19890 [Winslowiella toletana]